MEKREINLSDIEPLCLIKTVLKNIWMVVAAALIFAMAMSMYLNFLREPEYSASMTYAVMSKNIIDRTDANMEATQKVAAVFSELLVSDVITESIRTSSDKLTDFNGGITASQIGGSNLIDVTTKASTPERAFLSMNALINSFPVIAEYISDDAVVQIIRNPVISAEPENKINSAKACILSAAVGGLMMVVLLCVTSITGETIQTRAGAKHLLDVPVIASVSHEKKRKSVKKKGGKTNYISVLSPTVSFVYFEQIQEICSQIRYAKRTGGSKVFLVTSVGENEGKSTIAANIACALAMKKKNVALVDADFRNPMQYYMFNKRFKVKPLSKFLEEPFTVEGMKKCIQFDSESELYTLFSTPQGKKKTGFISGETMSKVIENLSVMDYVIIDSPPLGLFSDAEALAEVSDASLLVVRQNKVSACDINDAADTLRACKASLIGCVLNDMSNVSAGNYGYGYYNYYGKNE